MTKSKSSDSGVATTIVVWTALVVVLLGICAIWLGSVAISQNRVSQAADLGALAGAERVWSGPTTACAAARQIVIAHGAQVVSCQVVGLDVQVRVEAPLAGQLAGLGRVSAVARAGPPQ